MTYRTLPAGMPGDELIGRYKGEFLMHEESRPGKWRFYVRAVDIAGNASDALFVELTLTAPDNYVVLDQLNDLVPLGTFTNAVPLSGEYFGPICPETWAAHFTSRSWTSPSAQVAAGFPVYMQPACATPLLFVWEHDFGAPLPAVMIDITPVWRTVTPTPTTSVHVLSKALIGDAWTDNGEFSRILLPGNTQFIRVEVRISSNAGLLGIGALQQVGYQLSLQELTDAGTATIVTAATGIVVTFSRVFVSIKTVQLTVQTGSAAKSATYSLTGTTSMTIKAWDAVGAAATGVVAWFVRGAA